MKLHIVSAVKKYSKLNPARFHMPGHKGNLKIDSICDVTELDYIGNEKAIQRAQEDIKGILDAKASYILSGGSTLAILSAVYAVKGYGDKLIINRSAHKSVYNALKLINAEPITVANGITDGIADLPTAKETAEALDNNPSAIGVLYTYPDYFGRTFDIKGIYQEVKKRKKLLIIDGAHGGHFRFVCSELYAGNYADVWVDGEHKTLSTLNQGAILSVNYNELINKITEALNIFSTTSPSYPILASVEYGVKSLVEGKNKVEKVLDRIEKIIKLLDKQNIKYLYPQDKFKLAVDFGGSGIKTVFAEKMLKKHSVFVEMKDERYLLFMFSTENKKQDFDKLENAIKEIGEGKPIKSGTVYKKIIKEQTGYIKAVNSPYEYVNIKDAEGRISSENVGIFPPCYPIIIAGEKFTKEDINLFLKNKSVFGLYNEKVKVIKNER